ncbi:MAG: PadR family transcriptional regulator [Chloroflexi bacterium]|nr:PadR family transcriptional regulator [Chloroflexota bacterium]
MERELLLLGLLQRQEMHGYQLHEFIDSYMQTCVDLKKSTAYYLLEKMAREGLVSSSEEREGNRPPRLVYSLTAAGEAHFLDLLRQNLSTHLPARFPGDTGLTFLDNLPRADAISLLQTRQTALAQELARVEQAPTHTGSLQLLIEHQIVHLRSEAGWLEQVINHLANEI